MRQADALLKPGSRLMAEKEELWGILDDSLGESCSLSILHGDEVIYIARSTRKRIGSLHRDVGAHLPAHCTSMGRVHQSMHIQVLTGCVNIGDR